MKRFLQVIGLRTQFAPFTWVYRGLYSLSVRLCVRRLRRIRGVQSVYLRRGLATGSPVYGLSDIDLLVMVDGEPDGWAAARVRYQYELLRRIIPMLAQGELALYTPDQFRTLYKYSPFYRYRFDRGRHEWKHLFGTDIFSDLSPVSDKSYLLAHQELKPAWYYLAHELAADDDRPLFLRRYVAYKSIADAASATLLSREEAGTPSRETALVRASDLYPEISETLKEVGKWRHDLLSTEPIPSDRVVGAFLRLAHKTVANNNDNSRPWQKLRVLSILPDFLKTLLGESAIAEVQQACATLRQLERAVFVPRLNFEPIAMLEMDPMAFAGASVDAFDLVLIGQRLPPVEKLREFNRVMDRFHPAINTFFCDGQVAVSLLPIRGSTVIDRNSSPEFFACVSSAQPLKGALEIGGAVEVARYFEQPDSLKHRAQTLLALFTEAAVFRMPVRSFFSLFWEAGRVTHLAFQAHEPIAEVPVTSPQVVGALASLTPSAEPILRRVHREYWKELQGGPSEAVRYTQWTGLYALKLKELLFSSGARWMEPSGQARTELTISVVIITRDQAEFLHRALHSLVEQERRPDQVIVVDNASRDETPAVANSFADRLNLTLVREEKIGIPHARNAGLQHCTEDIVAYLDGDCEATPRWLAEMEVPFLKDPHIGAVGGSTVPITGDGRLISRFYQTRMHPVPFKEKTSKE